MKSSIQQYSATLPKIDTKFDDDMDEDEEQETAQETINRMRQKDDIP